MSSARSSVVVGCAFFPASTSPLDVRVASLHYYELGGGRARCMTVRKWARMGIHNSATFTIGLPCPYTCLLALGPGFQGLGVKRVKLLQLKRAFPRAPARAGARARSCHLAAALSAVWRCLLGYWGLFRAAGVSP